MIKEFEGKTEEEAITKAIKALGLNKNEFDVEIIGKTKKSFFRKGPVKIRIHVEEHSKQAENFLSLKNDSEKQIITFVEEIIRKMRFEGQITVSGREEEKVIFNIQSDEIGFLIGKHGKVLDALQVLANVYGGKFISDQQKNTFKIVLDSGSYRSRWEGRLIRLAMRAAQEVRRTRVSKLLEPMNPFERRLIHVTLNNMTDIRTESEGEGLIKQVRVSHVNHH